MSRRVVSWFSCGAASAVATKKAIQVFGTENLVIASCVVENEHPDNERFLKDCEAWFGVPILRLRSEKYRDCWEVWEKTRYLVGPMGARCTVEMKKAVRKKFQRVSDVQVFGFTAEEKDRAERFRSQNPEVDLVTPLIDGHVTKDGCFKILQLEGIKLPAMYLMGYENNNCIGCVKGGVGYWNKIRRDFPEVFDRMARLERSLKRQILKLNKKRIYLDELDPKAGRQQREPNMECGLWCGDNT